MKNEALFRTGSVWKSIFSMAVPLPFTPQPRPQTVRFWPNTVISRVGLMRKKLKMMSSTQANTLIRPGVRASPVERSMAA